jgi:hypothetical protein
MNNVFRYRTVFGYDVYSNTEVQALFCDFFRNYLCAHCATYGTYMPEKKKCFIEPILQ